MNLAKDFDVFFNPKELGQTATIDGVEVNGIFGNEADVDQEISGRRPMFTCATADVVFITAGINGSNLYINGKDYRIAEPRPDGTGVTRLILQVP